MTALLGAAPTYSLVEIIVGIIVLAAVIAILLVALKAFGITIPPWVVQIFWIVVVAVVAIVAIRFILTLF